MIKIVINIETRIAIMIKNAIKTNIAKKFVIMNRVTAGSGFGQMFDSRTVLGSDRTVYNCSTRRVPDECT